MSAVIRKNIAVIGSGYVGTTTASILSNCYYDVTTIDVDQSKIDKINNGKAPFFETGLDLLIKHAIDQKHLKATTAYEPLAKADIVFSCVGTPDNPDGSSNLDYVFAVAAEAVKHMKTGAIFVQKSTVPVGTGEKIESLFTKHGKKIHYVSNPEFLREGTAISDTLNFDRVVAGSQHLRSAETILELYKSVEAEKLEISARAGISIPGEHHGDYFITNRNSAELIKVTANAFLALKISFANSIAKFADQTGADINEVMDVVGADKRIGRAFLNAGRGYGGGCFPKDVSGLISSANEYGIELPIMTAASDVNETMPGYIAQKAQDALGKLNGKKTAVLGLAFKAGTSDARRSPGVKLSNILTHNGADVRAYDPEANGEAKEELLKGVVVVNSIEDAVKQADAVFIATDWPQFIGYDLSKLASIMKGKVFVDAVNVFSVNDVESAGLEYIGVGR